MKGLFIPGITVEMIRSGCLESIEALMAEDEIFNIDYDPRHIPAIRDKLWEIQECSNCVLNPKKRIVETKPQWTPVAEGLPEKEDEVLVTTSWDDVCMAWCDNGKWRAEYINEYDDDEIVAWMPKPESYKGRRKDD